jgi:hypothetical protein
MSGIGSVSGSSSSYYQWLIAIGGQAVGSTSDSTDCLQDALSSTSETSGVDSDPLKSLQEDIKSAITAALEEAQKSGDSDDLRKVIEEAIDEALKENGIDPEQVKMQPPKDGMGGPMPPPPMGGMGGMMPPGADASSEATDDSSESTNSESTNSSTATQLAQSLQELIAQLWGNQGENGTIVGFLFDVQA